jgi:hypothetical protein
MALGPGIYDDLCTYLCTHVRTAAKADAAIVIVLGGARGNGFSCQADAVTTARLPELLDNVAAQIRASMRSVAGPMPGDHVMVKDDLPEANSVTVGRCSNPTCRHVHVLLLDEAGEPMAEFVAPDGFAERLVEVERKIAGEVQGGVQ